MDAFNDAEVLLPPQKSKREEIDEVFESKLIRFLINGKEIFHEMEELSVKDLTTVIDLIRENNFFSLSNKLITDFAIKLQNAFSKIKEDRIHIEVFAEKNTLKACFYFGKETLSIQSSEA